MDPSASTSSTNLLDLAAGAEEDFGGDDEDEDLDEDAGPPAAAADPGIAAHRLRWREIRAAGNFENSPATV